jgi:uncharacterized metal-binding protein (TIGR02443 family)
VFVVTKQKKRFIAGAKCPSCSAMDTMVLFIENNVEKVECVKCQHQMAQPEGSVQGATRQFEQVIGVFNPED